VKAYYLGRVAYRPTWELQERLRTQVLTGGPETLLLCEHRPVLTLGKSATPTDILRATDGVEQVRTSRGGQVTYHGPGQLVVYLLLKLDHYQLSIRELVRAIEQAVINLLLTLCFWVPGAVHAILVANDYYEDRRQADLLAAMARLR